MNECPVLGAVNQLLNGRFWVISALLNQTGKEERLSGR